MPPPPSLLSLLPEQSDLTVKSILLSSISALIAISLVDFASQYTLSGFNTPIMVASMGASAVLLFVVPSSSLSTPWAFAGGHLVSALVGVCCAQWIHNIALAAGMAVGVAIFAMYYLRCMHPPGGAAALLAVVGGKPIHDLGFQFLLSPVLLNVTIMLLCALVYWRFAGIHKRPTVKQAPDLVTSWIRKEEDWLITQIPFNDDDLSHAITEMDTFIDINRQDLKEIYARALHLAHSHKLGDTRCVEIMSHPVISVEYGTELDKVWQLFEQHDIRGIPVVDSFERVIGMITITDFVHKAKEIHHGFPDIENPNTHSITEHLALLRQRTPGFESEKPEVAGQIMSSPVITAQGIDRIADILPVFTQRKIHHLPILDGKRKIMGMLTREDVMAATMDKITGNNQGN